MGNREDIPPRHGKGQAPISSSGDPVSNEEVTRMEHRRNDAREKIADGDRNQGSEDRLEIGSHDPRRGEEDGRPNVARASPTARGLVPKQGAASSWVSWQSGLYLLVLGVVCLVLVPLTSFWWIVPILGAVVPLALAFLERPDLELGKPDDKKHKEGELLEALAEWGEITPTTAAMRTSLTVDEASKMLDGLAGKGHLELQAEDGIMAYALRERDRPRAPSEVETPPDLEPQGSTEPNRPEDPLSERELEVLVLLASGRTNAEIAKDLFVAVGTVKSHVNNIYRKLGAANRAGAVTRARDLKLLR
jgi:DNA-binding CsgD family transcriptional regulator